MGNGIGEEFIEQKKDSPHLHNQLLVLDGKGNFTPLLHFSGNQCPGKLSLDLFL
jgi:hypothetical protein